VAWVLLAGWPVLTSHALLQHWGVIHEVHADHHSGDGSHEHDADNHAFADGGYLSGANNVKVTKPLSVALFISCFVARLLALICLFEREFRFFGPAPPGTSPPELSRIWQFFSRAALPVRAPSFLS
jgi:hypothetical protein